MSLSCPATILGIDCESSVFNCVRVCSWYWISEISTVDLRVLNVFEGIRSRICCVYLSEYLTVDLRVLSVFERVFKCVRGRSRKE